MSAVDVLLKLRQAGVKVWVEDDELRLGTTPEELPADLRAAVNEREAELIRFLRNAVESAAPSAPAISRQPPGEPQPLSFAQRRVWFLLQADPDSAAHNVLYVVRLKGQLDLQALEAALGKIIHRHEALRTTIGLVDEEPLQFVQPPEPFELAVEDFTGVADVDEATRQRAKEELQRPFDLATGPLYRFTALRFGRREHVLMFSMLHIITDGWSFGVLFNELSHFYTAHTSGNGTPLSELEIQYPDYAAWQRDWFAAEGQNQLDYWTQQLDRAPTLELPTDRPRPRFQTFGSDRHVFEIPRDELDRIKALGVQEGCTYFMTMLAAFSILLSRYSGQEDVVVGTPVANRDRPELEPLIGLFLNTLVLRTDLTDNPNFRELLKRVREVSLAAFSNKELPFEQLVVELKPTRDTSRNPIFQVLFNILYDTGTPKIGNVEAQLLDSEFFASMFDLSLILTEGAGALEYNTDLFDVATIDRMARHYVHILQQVVADPDQPVAELPLLSEEEQRLLLVEPNDTAADYPRWRCLHDLIGERVKREPDRVAVTCAGVTWTYRELDRRANQLAHHLIANGAQPGNLIGICVERSANMLVGLLGILKTGAAYVPLDPMYPVDRLAFIIEDAAIELLVTQQSVQNRTANGLPSCVRLDADADAIARRPSDPPNVSCSADDLAYVIFTSGSTGRPKGVEIQHRALVNFLSAMAERPGLSEGDVLVAVTTISFDIAGLELYLPLVRGAQVAVATDEAASDGRLLSELMRDSGCTIMQGTPAIWQLLIDGGWRGDPNLKLLCGGEPLPRELAEELLPRCRELWNMYGPTETTIWSMALPQTSGSGTVPIGGPIANTEIYVLDRYLHPVPSGVAGKLFIGGDGLARGYWRRPELTVEKFVPHPLRKHGRVYDTGDLVRWRPDGTLEFLGRVDHQVKLRGFRIELGEIEHVLAQHPAVKECAVVAQSRPSGDKQLAAFVTFDPGAAATVSELRAQLRNKLPDYMVPPAFVMLDELPRTPNSKIDRVELSGRDTQAGNAASDYEAPSTPTEKLLSKQWQELLDVDQVGLNDNFFDLGGHSLLGMKLLFRVEKMLGARVLPMELLMQNLRQFAELCDQRGAPTPSEPEPQQEEAEPAVGLFSRLRLRFRQR